MQDIQDIMHKTLLARTPAGKTFKIVAFWVAFVTTFFVPLGVLVFYYLWKHGDRIANDPQPQIGGIQWSRRQ